MRTVPWWAVLSSAAAPVIFAAGWTVAAALQPPGYHGTRDTISVLAGDAATDRWVMTLAFALVGACHLATALGLRPAGSPGRVLLAIGGAALLLVATLPLPRDGSNDAHAAAAALSFAALAVWPVPARRQGLGVGWALRPVPSVAASIAILALVGWFAVDLHQHDQAGLSERFVSVAQSLWPLVVVLSVVLARRGREDLPVGAGVRRGGVIGRPGSGDGAPGGTGGEGPADRSG